LELFYIIIVPAIIIAAISAVVASIAVKIALRRINAENSLLSDELDDIKKILRSNTARLYALEQERKNTASAEETCHDDQYIEIIKPSDDLAPAYVAAPKPEEPAEDFYIPVIPEPVMTVESVPEEPAKSFESVQSLEIPDTPEPVMTVESIPEEPAKSFKSVQSLEMPDIPASAMTMENWLGKRVFGIIAAVLIFIGLIYLGTLIYDKLGDLGKIALMYLFSFAMTAAGVALVKKTRNYFTFALAGCGCGALFISTLMAHIYFGKIPDYTAFSILLGWTAAMMLLSRLMKTSLFSAIAHIGMAISLCFAFSSGMSYEKLGLILVYQWVGIAVIVAGNFFFCRQTYLPGLLASFALTLIGSLFMMDKLGRLDMNGLIFAAYAGQFVITSFLSYFLTVYAIKSFKEEVPDFATAVHAVSKLLWLVSLSINVITPLYAFYKYCVGGTGHIDAVLCQTLAGFVIIAVHAAITVVMSKKYGLRKGLETVSISFLSVFSCGLLVYRVLEAETFISCLFALAIAMFALYRLCRNKVYLVLANIWICADVLLMIPGGYKSIYAIFQPLPVLYLAMILALMAGQMFCLRKEDKTSDNFHNPMVNAMKITAYILTHVSLLAFFIHDFYSPWGRIENLFGYDIYIHYYTIRSAIFITAVPLILNLTLFSLKFEKTSAALNCIMRITTVIILSLTALLINSDINQFLSALTLAASFLFVYAMARISVKENSSFSAISRVGELIIIFGGVFFINSGINQFLSALTIAASFLFLYAVARTGVRENSASSVISRIGELIIIAGCAVYVNSGINPLLSVLTLAGGFIFVYAAGRTGEKENNWHAVISRVGELILIAGCAVYINALPRPVLGLPVDYALIAACLGFAFLPLRGLMDNKTASPASIITEFNGFILIVSSTIYIINKDNRLMVSLIALVSLIFLTLRAAVVDRGGEKGRMSDITEVGGAVIIAACAWYFVNGGEALVTAFMVLLCCVFACIFGNINIKERGSLSIASRINEAVILAAGGYYIANLSEPSKPELIFAYAAITLLIFALAFIRINRDITANSHPLIHLYLGIKFTALTLCAAHGFTSWLEQGYILSIIVMVTALVCVLAGFEFRAKPLRVYGLVMTMICVAKLVVADVWGASTPMRVIAMISGGLICFAINAAYSYAVKQLDKAAVQPDPDPEQG